MHGLLSGDLLTEPGLTDHGACLTQGTVVWERWRLAECGPWARRGVLVLTLIHRTARQGLSGVKCFLWFLEFLLGHLQWQPFRSHRKTQPYNSIASFWNKNCLSVAFGEFHISGLSSQDTLLTWPGC